MYEEMDFYVKVECYGQVVGQSDLCSDGRVIDS